MCGDVIQKEMRKYSWVNGSSVYILKQNYQNQESYVPEIFI